MSEKLLKGLILPTKIVVKEIKVEEKKTSSGILLPETRRNPQTSGTILLTGCGTDKQPMTLKEGLIALFNPSAAQKFILDDEEFLVLDQVNVLFAYSE